eukprot:34784_1
MSNSDLISTFASKLKMLTLTKSIRSYFDSITFEQLEELSVLQSDNHSFDTILKSASNLKKILWRCGTVGLASLINNVEINKTIINMIVNVKCCTICLLGCSLISYHTGLMHLFLLTVTVYLVQNK